MKEKFKCIAKDISIAKQAWLNLEKLSLEDGADPSAFEENSRIE
jgi:hypothetical protein